MSNPFILGYKTIGLDITKVYKKGEKFEYPQHIPFFGVNIKPNMNIYKDKILCYEKVKKFHFKIILDNNVNKGNILIYDNNYSIVILKDYLF